VPTDPGAASRSASVAAARANGRRRPATRSTATARTPGPYCTGALTPAGSPSAAVAIVMYRQPHRRCSIRCPVTLDATAGRSNTCRVSVDTTGASASPAPHPPHAPAACSTTVSGPPADPTPCPAPPSRLPGRRPEERRWDRGGGLSQPSDDGGPELSRGFPRSWAASSATRAVNADNAYPCATLSVSRSASNTNS